VRLSYVIIQRPDTRKRAAALICDRAIRLDRS
jgi:hypothetical protein